MGWCPPAAAILARVIVIRSFLNTSVASSTVIISISVEVTASTSAELPPVSDRESGFLFHDWVGHCIERFRS